jgi:predicted RNA methylase
VADGNSAERLPLDGYFTPFALADALVDKLATDGFWRGGSLLEPSAGKGAFVVAAHQLQPHRLIALDIDPERCSELRQSPAVDVFPADFLTFGMASRFELIVGNPPYTGAEQHVRKALSMRAQFGAVAFLLRLAFLESAERIAFWQEHPASKIYALAQRPSFTGSATDKAAYGFFVWANWHRGPTELEVISWR